MKRSWRNIQDFNYVYVSRDLILKSITPQPCIILKQESNLPKDETPRRLPYPNGYNGLFIASFNISQIQLAVTKLKNSCLGQQTKEQEVM